MAHQGLSEQVVGLHHFDPEELQQSPETTVLVACTVAEQDVVLAVPIQGIPADEFWLDLDGLLPAWPVLITTGLLPLLLTLLGLAAVYLALRLLLKAAHGEALVGLFVFIVAGLLILTITGVYFPVDSSTFNATALA